MTDTHSSHRQEVCLLRCVSTNFYQVKLEAKKNKRIILESEEEPKREWVMV